MWWNWGDVAIPPTKVDVRKLVLAEEAKLKSTAFACRFRSPRNPKPFLQLHYQFMQHDEHHLVAERQGNWRLFRFNRIRDVCVCVRVI